MKQARERTPTRVWTDLTLAQDELERTQALIPCLVQEINDCCAWLADPNAWVHPALGRLGEIELRLDCLRGRYLTLELLPSVYTRWLERIKELKAELRRLERRSAQRAS